MTTINLTINASHPIHGLLDRLSVSLFDWLREVRSPEVTKILHGISRTMAAVKIASVGRRRQYHLGNAVDHLLVIDTAIRVLFQRRAIAVALFDLARRRLAQALKTVERLIAADTADWSQNEAAPLEERPADLAQDPTIKSLLLLFERVAEETRVLRMSKKAPGSQPDTPAKDAA